MFLESIKPGVGDVTVFVGDTASLFCNTTGLHNPKINWFKNGTIITQDDPRIGFNDQRKILDIKNSKLEDIGQYECVVITEDGEYVEMSMVLKVVGIMCAII